MVHARWIWWCRGWLPPPVFHAVVMRTVLLSSTADGKAVASDQPTPDATRTRPAVSIVGDLAAEELELSRSRRVDSPTVRGKDGFARVGLRKLAAANTGLERPERKSRAVLDGFPARAVFNAVVDPAGNLNGWLGTRWGCRRMQGRSRW